MAGPFRSALRRLAAVAILMAGVAPMLAAQEIPAASPPPLKAADQGDDRSGSAPVPPAPAANPGTSKPGVNRGTVLQLLFRANPMLWPLVACSIFTVGLVLERLLALRRKRIIPSDFVDRFLERLAGGKLDRDRALELCRANESPVARIFGLVVKSWGQPGATIRQTLSYDAAGELIELKRNLRMLNGMATLGPLLGLLGTVVGIIMSFDALGGRMGPSRGELLAQGISLALVATAFGLVVAILAVAAYYLLMNRVDGLARELDDRARQVIDLVSAEALRPPGLDRRHAALPASEPLRQETRAF